jgi:hypothetical protein
MHTGIAPISRRRHPKMRSNSREMPTERLGRATSRLRRNGAQSSFAPALIQSATSLILSAESLFPASGIGFPQPAE